jgi:hypothetical protein
LTVNASSGERRTDGGRNLLSSVNHWI